MADPITGPYGTTALIYNPTGADTDPIADGWTTNFTGAGHSAWKRLTNLMAPSTGGTAAQAYRAGATYGPDCEVWTKLPAKGATNGHYIDLTLMLASPNLAGRDFYFVEITVAAGADTWDIGRQFNAVSSGVLATGTQEITAGDWVAMSVRIVGGNAVITGWWWNGSKWVAVVTFTDSSASKITAAGFYGLEATVNSAWRVDDQFGGTIPPGPYAGSGGSGHVATWNRLTQERRRGRVFTSRHRSRSNGFGPFPPPTLGPASTFVARPIKVELAPSRRVRTRSFLRPPVEVGPKQLGFFGPGTRLTDPLSLLGLVRRRPHSFLRPPTVVRTGELARPTEIKLARSSRGQPKSHLGPPVVVAPVLARPLLVHLAPSTRGRAKSRLSPPAVVGPVLARPILTKFARIRPAPVHSTLRRPTDLIDQADLGFVRVHLAYSLRGKPKSRLSPPAVVAPVLARPIQVHLVRIRPVPVRSILRRPTDLVDQADLGFLRTHLTYSRRGAPKSRLAQPSVVAPVLARPIITRLARIRPARTLALLHPPAVVFKAVEIFGPEVTLAPQSRRPGRWILGPMGPAAVAYEPIRVTLAPQSRRPGRWLLRPMGPPAVVYAPIAVHLTYSVRGKPKSILRPDVKGVPVPKAETTLSVTLAYSRRGAPKSRLARVVYAAKVYAPISVTLAPQRRGRAISILSPPAVVGKVILAPLAVHLAPSRRGQAKSRLLQVVYPARVYAPVSVTLVPSRRPRTVSFLSPPAVAARAAALGTISTTLARIRPARVRSFLRPPVVVAVAVTYRGILVHLAYSRRGETMWKLEHHEGEVPVCYGTVDCAIDFSPEVCGTDEAPTVDGSDTSATAVGSDSSATVEGASESRGSVCGSDETREGC